MAVVEELLLMALGGRFGCETLYSLKSLVSWLGYELCCKAMFLKRVIYELSENHIYCFSRAECAKLRRHSWRLMW